MSKKPAKPPAQAPASPPKPKRKNKPGAGRPPFEPTEEQRRYVRTMTAYGAKVEDVAWAIINPQTQERLDEKTLRKYFGDDLRQARIDAHAKMGESIYLQGVGAPAVIDPESQQVLRAEQPRFFPAARFYAATQMGWREKVETEHTFPAGIPPQDVNHHVDVTDASKASLAELAAAYREIAASTEPPRSAGPAGGNGKADRAGQGASRRSRKAGDRQGASSA